MKIAKFKSFMTESELSPLQKEYQEYFKTMLSKYGVASPADLDEETMSSFFNDVSDGWIKGKGRK